MNAFHGPLGETKLSTRRSRKARRKKARPCPGRATSSEYCLANSRTQFFKRRRAAVSLLRLIFLSIFFHSEAGRAPMHSLFLATPSFPVSFCTECSTRSLRESAVPYLPHNLNFIPIFLSFFGEQCASCGCLSVYFLFFVRRTSCLLGELMNHT